MAKAGINYFCASLGAVPVPGCVAPCGELPWQQFFPLPFWQHCFAPPSLLHIFAPFWSQHFLSQPPLQHFSPLQAPFRTIGQFAPMGACGDWAKAKAVNTRRNDRNEMVRFMEISLTF